MAGNLADPDSERTPFLCDLCNESADPTLEYTTAVTCAHPTCGKRAYHTACWEHYQRTIGFQKGRQTGYGCPRGHGKCPQYHDNPCKGKANATHHRMPGKRKPVAAVAPPVAQQLSKPVHVVAKKPAAKPGPALPAGGTGFTREQLMKQLAARQIAVTSVGDQVAARLGGGGGGGPVPGAIPGMEPEDVKPKAKKKKKKACPNGAGGKASKEDLGPVGPLTQLPTLDPRLLAGAGDAKLVMSIDHYNKLVGAYMSDSEDEECEDEEDCDASTEASSSVVNMPGSVGGALTSGSVFQPAAGLPAAWAPAPAFGGPDMSRSVSSAALSSLSSSGTHQEGGGSSLGSPVALEPNNSTTRVTSPVATPRLTSLPPGAIDPADIEAMIAAGADISVLRFDFSFVKEAAVTDEMLNYCAALPRVVGEMYINQLVEHVNSLNQPEAARTTPNNGFTPAVATAAAVAAPPPVVPPVWAAAPAAPTAATYHPLMAQATAPAPAPVVVPPAQVAPAPVASVPVPQVSHYAPPVLAAPAPVSAAVPIPYKGVSSAMMFPGGHGTAMVVAAPPAGPLKVGGGGGAPGKGGAGGEELDELMALCLGE